MADTPVDIRGGIPSGTPMGWCGHGAGAAKPIYGAINPRRGGLERGGLTFRPSQSTSEGLKRELTWGRAPYLSYSSYYSYPWAFLCSTAK